VGFVVFVLGGALLRFLYETCNNGCKSQSHQKNTIFVNPIYQKIDGQEESDFNPFQSGVWSSQYFQDERWHGPHQFPISFDSQSMKIK
jgi:hypothetical protein